MQYNITFLMEVNNRDTKHSIIAPVEKVYSFDEHTYRWEGDRDMEYYARARYQEELRHQPAQWKALMSENFYIDCVLLSKAWPDGRPYETP